MNKKIAQVIPLTRLKRDMHYFDYAVTDELVNKIKRGQLVEIPFRNKKIKGIVFNLTGQSETKMKLKPIEAIIDPLPFVNKWQLKLISFLAEYYYVSMSVLIKMMIPEIPKRVRKTGYEFMSDYDFVKIKKMNTKVDQIYKYKKPVLLKSISYEYKINTYLDLIKKAIKKKKQVLIIAPQITDLRNIYKYLGEFKELTSVFLNDMPKNLYWQEWQKIKNGEVNIIIGTRSAIIAPFKDLDMIIIDKEDNENHKQEEPNPRYNVKTVALKIHELTKCKLFFVSNSPSLLSLNKVHKKDWQYLEIDKMKSIPEIKIIDRQDEYRKGNYTSFSEELLSKLEYNLKRGRKVFLFLNRKGTSTLVSCKDCGYLSVCPTCNLPFTLHGNKKLVCHHCDNTQDLFLHCPKCKGTQIKITGTGTEKIESEIKELYPQSRILKLDQETPYIDQRTDDFDIIIGTQYAFNYIDWQQINLVGVINADTLLYLPDYRSMEKSFNLLIKLANFVAKKDKEIIIQSFTPQNYIFKAIKTLDYKNYYINELNERKAFNYPPYSKLIRLIYQSIEYNAGQREIEAVYENIKTKADEQKIIISPPMQAYTQQIRGRWRWQIIIKVIDQEHDLTFLNELPENIIIDRDPESLL